MVQVQGFRVKRCFLSSFFLTPIHMPLHGFSDASKEGYAAAIYIRQVDSKSEVCVSFLQNKSRAASKFRVHVPQATIPT
ncbi:hypothetical protein CAPTEDRAFT_119542 [Capitella teleta]|uniref:Uncharacterized protein n=1 Tax=Capitella teleta TaxID=283909 RepID=R7TG08_CAPTE|nr:hypothetical protein CAPTEDRAFT_119542 [Capitella teleta]|eukprot:ELT92659.1 hypothetical protein CAPTEDRAFT_119542 [Capitella teleta]